MRGSRHVSIPNNSAISKIPNIFESVIAITYKLHTFTYTKCCVTSFCIKICVWLFVATIQKREKKNNKKI